MWKCRVAVPYGSHEPCVALDTSCIKHIIVPIDRQLEKSRFTIEAKLWACEELPRLGEPLVVWEIELIGLHEMERPSLAVGSAIP